MTARTQPSRLWVGIILICAPMLALAQAPGEGLLDSLITLMTDSYARLIAILAIIGVGFLWLFGRIDACPGGRTLLGG